MEKVNLQEKFSQFSELWSPKIIGEINDTCVKIAKLKGEFLWHSHETEDEMFLVIAGELTIKFHGRDVLLRERECLVIPHGVEHMPVAKEEVHVMTIEPKTTLNTGNVVNERTIQAPERI